jgi:hypothetical protein
LHWFLLQSLSFLLFLHALALVCSFFPSFWS